MKQTRMLGSLRSHAHYSNERGKKGLIDLQELNQESLSERMRVREGGAIIMKDELREGLKGGKEGKREVDVHEN